MSNTLIPRLGSLAVVAALLASSLAHAQTAPTAAPVPGQIIAAKRMFVSNAGSESYGAEHYFDLTNYDGGPDRFYNQFYVAMKQWNHWELTDAPADADVVGEVRFRRPIVDQITLGHATTQTVYDPQLTITIVDPKTRVALWSLTEHIEPARTRSGDNQNFDQAVARIVERTRMLSSGTTLASADGRALSIYDAAPAGAVDLARTQQRTMKIFGSASMGALAGMTIAANTVNAGNTFPGPDARPGPSPAVLLGYGVAGAVLGGLAGLLWANVTGP